MSRARNGAWLAFLAVSTLLGSACALRGPAESPSPQSRPELTRRVAADSTDTSAASSLAVLDVLEGQPEAATSRLEAVNQLVPRDPGVPVLLALADEANGDYPRARTTYTAYASEHVGRLGRFARSRGAAIAPAAFRLETRQPGTARSRPIDPDAIAVMPFALGAGEPGGAAAGAALAALLASDLRSAGQLTVDDQRVRVTVDELGFAPGTYADLSVAMSVGTVVRAGSVVQGSTSVLSPDSVVWQLTLVSLGDGPAVRVSQIAMHAAAADPIAVHRRLSVLARRLIEGPPSPGFLGPRHTESWDALAALGEALIDLDGGDLAAAEAAATTALDLEPDFPSALGVLERVDLIRRTSPLELNAAVVEVARLGALQRSLLGLWGNSSSAQRMASERVGRRERALLSDVLGLDRIEGGTLVDLTLHTDP